MYTTPLCVALIATIVKIEAYSFDNPYYNQILSNDLEDLYSNPDFTNVRNRRDASSEMSDTKCPGPKRGPPPCCDDISLRKFKDGNKEYKEACFKEVIGKDKPDKPPQEGPMDPFDCEKIQQRKNDILCVAQCVGQKNKFIDDDGKVKPDEFGKYIKDQLAEQTYLTPVVDKIIEGCIADIKNATNIDGKCKPDALVTDFCIFKNIQLNCPAEQIKNKEACTRFQKMMSERNGIFMGPHLFGPHPPGFPEPPPPPPNS